MKIKLVILFIIYFCLNCKAQQNDSVFRYDASFTAFINKGNLDQVILSDNLLLSKSTKKIGFRFKNSSFHQWISSKSYDVDYYPSLIIFYKPLSKISPYIVLRYEQSKRRGLENRYMEGAGVSFLFNNKPAHLLRLSSSLMYDATYFSSQDLSLIGKIDSKKRQLFRMTGLINGNHTFFQNNLHIIYEIWVQSNVEYLQDIRYQIDTNIDSRIYKNIFLRMKIFYFYETISPATLKQGDLRMSFGITIKNI